MERHGLNEHAREAQERSDASAGICSAGDDQAAALDTDAIYQRIVTALASDYFDLYYVDVQTDEYIEYESHAEDGGRVTKLHGTDFFGECKRRAPGYIYEEDLECVAKALSKEHLLGEIQRHGSFIYHYRLLIDGAPTYVSMKATRIAADNDHIILGVSNVNTQVRDHMDAERAAQEQRAYLRLSALSENLVALFFVDPKSGHYTEFSSSKGYKGLGIARQGDDFFQTTHENSKRTVHSEDIERFRLQVTKQNVLATIDRDGMFSLDYRLTCGGLPTYVRLKAALVEEDGKPSLMVGLLDEDRHIQQEQEYARKLSVAKSMAIIDPLTGVKNKHAYAQWEERINASIRTRELDSLAVVICDVNNLKDVNDLYGHKEGDACIKRACAKICHVFSHSPVFRIGGDEFVALLTGSDYGMRAQLLEEVNALPKDLSKVRVGETIAAGMAEYQEDRHTTLLSVFEEADKAMYERKQLQKEMCALENRASNNSLTPSNLPAINVRKRILIVDDVQMNREILGELLADDYDIAYACDGVEALETLRSQPDYIALVLLDLYMPNMTGREVLAEMQVDEDLMSIPVIVLTVDQAAELDSLKIGAMDFIPKPYPNIEIVQARVAKCIELGEDRELIRHTERDKLTGLLNKDYFFRYVSRLDHIHKETALDAVMCDVNRFHAANKRYGRQFCDSILRGIGVGIQQLAQKTGGIGCRQEGDTFLLYCPHQESYEQLLGEFSSQVFASKETANRVSLRFGVFSNAQQEPDIEERFARARIAADRARNGSRTTNTTCGYYNEG